MSEEQTQTNADSREPKISRLAIWSIVCGLISSLSFYIVRFLVELVGVPSRNVGEFIFGLLMCVIPLFCVASIILCIMALSSIKQSNGELKGKGLAILGPAISIGHIVFFILRLYCGPWGGPPSHW